MEQSGNEDERKDDCGDKQESDDAATTSKADVNDPIQIAYNVNDLKAFEFNSADDVRQTMKALINEKKSQESVQAEKNSLIQHEDTKTDLTMDVRGEIGEEKVIVVNVGEIKRDLVTLEIKKLPRKRPGRPPKSGPSKRYKRTGGTKAFYIGKLSNLVFVKRKYRYTSSSDEVSIKSS